MRGKAGPTPGPVKTAEEKAAEKEAKRAAAQAAADAKAQERADAKAAKEKDAADKKAAKEAEKAAADAAKAQKAAAKNAPAGIGHNSEPLSDEEKRAILVNGVSKIIGFQEEIASINSALRNERKRLIANGFERFEVDFAIKLRKSENEDTDLDEWRKLQRVALFMNHPIGTQPDLFGVSNETVDRTPLADKAYQAGKMAGLEAKTRCEPPHGADTEAGQKWIEGWHDGQALLVRQNIHAPIVKKAEPAQESFDDVLADAPSTESFEQPAPDHANDPTSSANPANAAA